MFFDSETPSHLLAYRAILYHLFPLALFAACEGIGVRGGAAMNIIWSTTPGHFVLVAIFDMLVICGLMSLMALVKAWQEDIVVRKILIFPLFIADIMLSIFTYLNLHIGA